MDFQKINADVLSFRASSMATTYNFTDVLKPYTHTHTHSKPASSNIVDLLYLMLKWTCTPDMLNRPHRSIRSSWSPRKVFHCDI